jgi:putative membrane protein
LSRALRLAGLLLGIALVAWLVSRTDLATLSQAFAHIGWGFAAILAARGLCIAVDCAAWDCLLTGGGRPHFVVMLALRWIGESINTTLPAAQIGGDVVRARLLQRRLAVPAHGAASVAVDFCLSLLAQIIFTLIGFVLLAHLSAAASLWPILVSAAIVPLFALASWELLVRRRFLRAAERFAERLGRRRIAAALAALAKALSLIAGGHSRLALSLTLHLVSWLGHIGELWLTLYLMGVPVGFAEAAMLESLSLTARSVAFLIPSGWGAQEAALIGLAVLTGMSAEAALALGLVKRAREFAVGLPGLVAWAIIERGDITRTAG